MLTQKHLDLFWISFTLTKLILLKIKKRMPILTRFAFLKRIIPLKIFFLSTNKGRLLLIEFQVVLVMMRVFMLSVKFRMGRLEHLCQKYIEVILNLNNVLVALNNASVLSLVSIKESCLKFITKESNYSQVNIEKETFYHL